MISPRRFMWSTAGGVIMTFLSILAWSYRGRGPLPGTLLNSLLICLGLPYWLVTGWLGGTEQSGNAAFLPNTVLWALTFYAGAIIIARLRGGKTRPHDRGAA